MPAVLPGCGNLGQVSPPAIPVPKLAGLADVPHAIPYQGSKRLLAHAIVRLIPAGTPLLVEPFAGSAAVTIAARYLGAVPAAEISDINAPLIALWREIIDNPVGLAADYEHVWHEQLADPRGYYEVARAEFNETEEPVLLLYLLARCVKAAVRYSRGGRFNQSADHRRLGARPKAMRDRILRTSAAARGTVARPVSYEQAVLAAPDESVVYLDPPYQGVSDAGDHRYVRGLDRRDFERVLFDAVRAGKSFVVSYDVVTQDRKYGDPLSAKLGLTHLHVEAGRSSQATLQGIARTTVESLYISPALLDRLGGQAAVTHRLSARRSGY